MKSVVVRKVSEPSKGKGRKVVSEQVEIEGNPPYVRKVNARKRR